MTDDTDNDAARMIPLHPAIIRSWHAHVYFDADTRSEAWALRELIGAGLPGKVEIGRFHERPVGPHPMWSFQLAFLPDELAYVVGWLTLNRGTLDVFAHPNTGDALCDHRDRALWLGNSHALKLSAFASGPA